jgi:type IV pilus assembly protein PilY1
MNVSNRTTRRLMTLALLLSIVSIADAEDIDIFARVPPQNDLPNVLLMWDSSANWGANIPVGDCYYAPDFTTGPKATAPDKEQGTKFGIEKCALYNVIYMLDPKKPGDPARFNIGLELFNESGSAQGAYPRKAILPLTWDNKTALLNAIRNVAINADKANNGPYAQAMQDMYLEFAKKAYRGTPTAKWDPAATAGGLYVGSSGIGCGKNFIIWLSNGSPNENNTDALAVLAADGAPPSITKQLVYPTAPPDGITNSDQADWADEFAKWMRGVDVSPMDGVQSITTHAVAIVGSASDGLYPNFIRAITKQGGGEFNTSKNLADLTMYLLNVFNAIDTANAVFASASLPIDASASGSYRNQVFVGMFRPDELARTRWYGNLKQYKMAYDPGTQTLGLVDSLGNQALNAATGFFTPSAVSYWTEDSAFWVNDLKGTPPSGSDDPDGEIVEKGAVAQRLRIAYKLDQSTRNVYTCIACAPGTILSTTPSARFDDANSAITSAMLGASSSSERTSIINWVRGTDNARDEKGPNDGTTTVRPSIHGDVLHSRPTVVDYGGSIGTVVFYGSNDGTLRAVNGNQTGTHAGDELWAFVPTEVIGRLKRLRDNLPEIRYPITPSGAYATPRDYFVDGPITSYQKISASGSVDQVMIFVSMRRGGRLLYAFDVTNPAMPQLVWRKSSADISGLGQTWSEAKVMRVRGYPSPVLVMGAGYDATAEDALPAGTVTMGNAVIILDATTGTTLATLPTVRSVPAGVAALDTDFDGYTDRLYAVDMGANVYRIDLETSAGVSAPGSWTITKIAALDDGTRKFYNAPDVVQTANFTAVLVGSGNRERPLLATTSDRFYTLFDYKATKGAPSTSPISNASLIPQGGAMTFGSTAGCYLALDTSGEKVVTSAVSTGGYTYFSTNRPDPGTSPTSCAANLGIAKAYRLPLFCGAPESMELAGGGLPPSPVIGDVEVPSDPNNPNGPTSLVPFIIGGFNPELSSLGPSKVPIAVDPTRRRTFWYTNKAR